MTIQELLIRLVQEGITLIASKKTFVPPQANQPLRSIWTTLSATRELISESELRWTFSSPTGKQSFIINVKDESVATLIVDTWITFLSNHDMDVNLTTTNDPLDQLPLKFIKAVLKFETEYLEKKARKAGHKVVHSRGRHFITDKADHETYSEEHSQWDGNLKTLTEELERVEADDTINELYVSCSFDGCESVHAKTQGNFTTNIDEFKILIWKRDGNSQTQKTINKT